MSDWRRLSLSDVVERFIDYRGKTPQKIDYGVPLVTAKIVKNGKIEEPKEFIAEKDYDTWMTRGIPEYGDVVITTEAPMGKVAQLKFKGKVALAQRIITLRGKSDILDNTFLLYSLQSEEVQNQLVLQTTGTTVQGIKASELKKIEILLPPLQEQQKIADILSSVDKSIEKTEAIIEQTEKVKRGLMQQLLTKGIGHTKFKKTEIGEVPEEWEVVKLRDVLELITRPLSMKDEEEYQLVTVKRRQAGVVPREILKGKEIKVKSQFYIKTGDFLISKRQIVHGACEVVPLNLDGAIVSNEYHTLLPKENLNMDFFKWYSRTSLMMNYFLLSSVGVHIEKMLFKLEDWFKREIALPPLDEQAEIAKTLSSVQKSIDTNSEYLKKLQVLKNGLMQSLLTGKVRVKVDKAEVTQV